MPVFAFGFVLLLHRASHDAANSSTAAVTIVIRQGKASSGPCRRLTGRCRNFVSNALAGPGSVHHLGGRHKELIGRAQIQPVISNGISPASST